MRNTLFRRLWQIPVILTAIVLTASFFPFQPMALAAETAQEAAEEAGSQAFLDFSAQTVSMTVSSQTLWTAILL